MKILLILSKKRLCSSSDCPAISLAYAAVSELITHHAEIEFRFVVVDCDAGSGIGHVPDDTFLEHHDGERVFGFAAG